MDSTIGTTRLAGVLPIIAASMTLAIAVTPANAEPVKTVNGVGIEQAVLDLYIQSRANVTPDQVPAQQREALLQELTDIYLLTTQEAADEFRKDPQIAAQIELQSRGVIAQAVAGQFFANAEISEEEIAAEYAQQTSLAPPLQFKARHILLETQGAAADVIAELNDGADFSAVAMEKSTGPSGPNGGDLGWFSPDQMVPPFSAAVAELEDGSYTTAPVQTDFGWHVILREDSRETEAPPLDSVREQIVQKLQQDKFSVYLESLRSE